MWYDVVQYEFSSPSAKCSACFPSYFSTRSVATVWRHHGGLRFSDCLASPPPMVKFGETIQEGKKPEWVEGYVDYDGLKKLLERMEAAGTTRE